MTPESRAAISRTNGARSRGLVTTAGRKKSSRYALKHGFNSGNIVLLDCESRAEFKRFLDEHLAMHQPISAIERSLAQEMVASHRRIRGLWTIETTPLNLVMFRGFTRYESCIGCTPAPPKQKMTNRTQPKPPKIRVNLHEFNILLKNGLSENEPKKPHTSRPKQPQTRPNFSPAGMNSGLFEMNQTHFSHARASLHPATRSKSLRTRPQDRKPHEHL